ncbi:hypothetical protein [Dyella acidiphila]|uniref:Uncharacterized protein n=1 Tax=Dyella acidiphila TaxID=2775866 RepID=A0ABR9G6R6_9GAMM|nr:hypothetical protein [Dyella acidiphila]MBE1159735.1 hypothetical protein [Dyella acidiphila]
MRSLRARMAVFGCLVLQGCLAAAHAQSPVQRVAGFGLPVSNERLATVRGGFDLGEGLEASLGIERAVYIDGNLVTYTSVNIPDLAHVTTQQAAALASALSTVNVQNGPGNSFDPSTMGNATATTVIQNTLNNQTIRNLTTLNVAVNTLNAFRDQAMQQALQAAQVQALGH